MLTALLPLIFSVPLTGTPTYVPDVPVTPYYYQGREIRRSGQRIPVMVNRPSRVKEAIENGRLLPTVERLSKRTVTRLAEMELRNREVVSRFPTSRSFLTRDNTYVQRNLRFSFRYPRTWVTQQSLEAFSLPFGSNAVWAVTIAPEKSPYATSASPLPVRPIADGAMPLIAEATPPGTISLVIEELPDLSISLEAITRNYVDGLSRAGYTPEPCNCVAAFGLSPAEIVNFWLPTGDRVEQAWSIVGDRVYLLTLRADTANEGSGEQAFRHILASFDVSARR